MKPEVIVILGTFAVFTILEIFFTDFFNKPKQKTSDGIVEVLSSALLIILIQPLVLFLGGGLTHLVAPNAAGSLSEIPIIAGVLFFLVFDDMTQYWWHRLSHNVTWLYNLHRPHHNAEYLSVRVVYRNNVFYY